MEKSNKELQQTVNEVEANLLRIQEMLDYQRFLLKEIATCLWIKDNKEANIIPFPERPKPR